MYYVSYTRVIFHLSTLTIFHGQYLFDSLSESSGNSVGRWDTYPKLMFTDKTRY
jgi:hypothetical protein